MPPSVPADVPEKGRDSERTKRRLTRAAAELFGLHGYAQVGVRDIADKAGVHFTLVRRYFGSKKGIFAAALEEVLPADLFDDFALAPSGDALVDAFAREPAEHARALPMLLLSSGDVVAREIALKAFRDKVAGPLSRILGDDAEAERRAVCILAVATGFFAYHRLFPIEPMASPLSAEMRRWLAQTFQAIVERDREPA